MGWLSRIDLFLAKTLAKRQLGVRLVVFRQSDLF
jgi:hypothetical protein